MLSVPKFCSKLLEKEADGGDRGFCPTLKGCHSQGDSVEEAIAF